MAFDAAWEPALNSLPRAPKPKAAADLADCLSLGQRHLGFTQQIDDLFAARLKRAGKF